MKNKRQLKQEGVNDIFFLNRLGIRKIELAIKRLMDIVGALIALIFLLPFLCIIAVLIKIDSKGPVFFFQERLGKNLKVFKIIKFRTMVTGAENIGDGLFVYGDGDSRITKIGRFLRKTSLDELPQLLNVLIGDMSIVGPRPPVTYFPYKASEYDSFKKRRFKMRPGITGKAQVMARTTASWDKRIEYDVEYVENYNLIADIRILFNTFKVVVRKKNIYPVTPGQIDNSKEMNM